MMYALICLFDPNYVACKDIFLEMYIDLIKFLSFAFGLIIRQGSNGDNLYTQNQIYSHKSTNINKLNKHKLTN